MPSLTRATAQQVVVLVGRRQPRADVQPLLGLREPGRQRVGGVARPVRSARASSCERGRRRAKRTGPVDRRRAADAAALQDVDRLVGGLARRAFLVQRRVGLALELVEVAARLERALFDHHHVEPGLALSSSAVMPAPAPLPTMATSQSSVCRERAAPRGAAEDLPAARQAVADRVRDRLMARVHARSAGRAGVAQMQRPGRGVGEVGGVRSGRAARGRPAGASVSGAAAHRAQRRLHVGQVGVLPGAGQAASASRARRELPAGRAVAPARLACAGGSAAQRGIDTRSRCASSAALCAAAVGGQAAVEHRARRRHAKTARPRRSGARRASAGASSARGAATARPPQQRRAEQAPGRHVGD